MANPFNKEAPIRNAASELPGVLGQGAPIQYAAPEEITENRFLGQEVPIQNAAPEEKIKNSFLGQEVPIQNAAPEEPKKNSFLGQEVPIQNAAPAEPMESSFRGQEVTDVIGQGVPIQNIAPEVPNVNGLLGQDAHIQSAAPDVKGLLGQNPANNLMTNVLQTRPEFKASLLSGTLLFLYPWLLPNIHSCKPWLFSLNRGCLNI